MSELSPFSLSLILDCLHKLVLALRAYSCLKVLTHSTPIYSRSTQTHGV